MQEKTFLNKTTETTDPFTITSPDSFIAVYGDLGVGSVKLQVERPTIGGSDFFDFANLTYEETAYERLGIESYSNCRLVFDNCTSANVCITSAV